MPGDRVAPSRATDRDSGDAAVRRRERPCAPVRSGALARRDAAGGEFRARCGGRGASAGARGTPAAGVCQRIGVARAGRLRECGRRRCADGGLQLERGRRHAAVLRNFARPRAGPVADAVELPGVRSTQGSRLASRGRAGRVHRRATGLAASGRQGLLRHPLGHRPARYQPARARGVLDAARAGQGARAHRSRTPQRRRAGAGVLRCDSCRA